MRQLLIAGFVYLASASLAIAAPDRPTRPGGPRIRPQDARTAKFLQEGLKRSATLRWLVARIETSDVIVYVGIDPLLRTHLAGALTFMSSGGDFRYVRAKLSGDQSRDMTISTLAHELQHALEVVEDAAVVDEPSLVALYRRIGVESSDRWHPAWDTVAAQDTGDRVRRELASRPASAVAASLVASGFEGQI